MSESLKIVFGAGNEITVPADKYGSVGEILTDSNLQAFLGFGESVEARLDGIAVSGSSSVANGGTLSIETKANTKGN